MQWALAIPHLLIAWALRTLRQMPTLISFFTVLFTTRDAFLAHSLRHGP